MKLEDAKKLVEDYAARRRSGQVSSSRMTLDDAKKSVAEYAKYRKVDTSGVDGNYINQYLSDAQDFFRNSATPDESQYGRWKDLNSRRTVADAWLYKNKSAMSDDDYLEAYGKLRIAGSAFDDMQSYWDRFDSEDAYRQYVTDYKAAEAKREHLTNMDVNAVAQAKADYDRLLAEYSDTTYGLTDEQAAEWGYDSNLRSSVIGLLSKYGYSSYEALAADWAQVDAARHYQVTQNEDFAELSKALTDGDHKATYNFINDIDGARDAEVGRGSMAFSGTSGAAFDRAQVDQLEPYLQMTDEEIGIYNYYYATDRNKAEEYLSWLYPSLQERQNNVLITGAAKLAEDHPIFASALSVPLSLGSGVEYIGDTLKYAVTGNSDTNSRASMSSAIRGTVSEKASFEIAGWDAGAFLYNTAMSGLDSAASMLIPFSCGGVMLGLSAAAAGTNDALERGMSNEQAFWNGLFSGVFEGVFESISIGNFKALKEVSPDSIKDIAKNIGKSMLVNASEETLTEIANIAYDTLMNGEYANYTLEELRSLGTWAELGGQIAESALSGGLMGFGLGGGAVGYAKVNRNTSKLYGGSRMDMQSLVTEALELDPNSPLALKLQKKLDSGKNLSGRELAMLVRQNETAIEKQGEDESSPTTKDTSAFEDATPGIETMLRERETDSLGDAKNAAESDSATLERERSLHEESWREWETERYQEWGRSGKDFASARAVLEKNGDAHIPSAEAFKIYTQAKNEAVAEAAADRVKVTVIASGEDSSVVRVASTSGGRVTVELEDGRRVAVSDVTFENPDTAVLYTGAATMNAASANAMIEGFDGASDALNYVRGWQEAYNSARYGIDLSESRFASTLTEEQLEAAKKAGKADRRRERATVGENRTEKRKGTLHRETDTSNLSEAQAAAVEVLETLVKSLGIDIYLYSEAGSTHNGWYDRTDGSIHLNLAADLSAEGTLLFTAAHELTHYIRDYAPDKFGTLADFLLTQYGEHGVSVSELVERQMGVAEEDGRQIDYDTAFEEVIASSMETMLQSGNVVEAIAKLKAKDATLWEKFAQYFRNLAERIRKAFRGLSPTSREGRYVSAMKDAAERLEAMFTDALVTASGRTKNTAEGGVKYSLREDQNGDIYVDVDGGSVSDNNTPKEIAETLSNIVRTKFADFVEVNRQKIGINQRTAREWVGSRDAAMLRRIDNQMFLDKANAFGNADEILQATRDYIGEAAKHQRKDNFVEFARGIVSFKVDERGYDADVIVGTTKSGVAILYDLVNLQSKTIEPANQNAIHDRRHETPTLSGSEGQVLNMESDDSPQHTPEAPVDGNATTDISIPHESDSVKRKFSTDSTDVPTLQADNAALRADVARLVESLHLQKGIGTRFTEETVQAAAKRLMDWAGARGDVRELTGMLHGLYEFIAKGEGVTWDTIRQRSEPIVDWLSAHRKNATEQDPEIQDLKRYLRPLKVRLSDAQMRQVEALYGSYNEYRKQLFGTVNLSKDAGVTLDEVWSEMAGQFPGIFDASEVDTDMPGVLLDVVKAIRENRFAGEMELALDAMIEQGLYQQVYESYWDAATMRSLGEITDRKIADLKREHKRQMDNLRRRRDEQIQRVRKEAELEKEHYRKRTQLKEAEAREKYNKSLDNWRDARERTELRRKAFKVYSELLTLLKDPTKKKHILPELQKAVAEALKVVDMDSVNAAERIERLQIKLREAKTETERAKIEKSIARIEAASEKVADRLGVLEQAYKAVLESPEYADEYGAEEILRRIEALKADVKDTTFVHLDRHQLQKLYELFVVTRTQVRNANRLFDDKRNTSVVMESNKIQEEVAEIGKDKDPATDRFSIFRKQEWNNLKPVYAVEKVGARGFRKLFDGLLRGESKYGIDMKESREFFEKTVEDCGYWSWDQEAVTHHESSDGKPFALNLLQKMSLYAYERRGDVALRHIEGGGLTFDQAQKYTKVVDGKKVDYYVRYGDKFPLTRLQVHEITETLTLEQKRFVETMQEYLSKNMGAKGNEVARVLYGIDLFGEPNYFPMQTVDGGKEQTNAPVDLVKLREMGMTQKTQAQASNALKLGSFTDVWANHCHQMSLYHSMVLPLEDFTRVWNYTAGGRSVKNEVQAIYGKEAVAYFEELLKQLNGGVRADSVELAYSKWLSGFKKAATFASASVVIQQRSAIARAYGEILPQYFRKGEKMRRADALAELQKYAGCAVIKEMGGFDTGMGGGSAEWLVRRKYTNKLDSLKGMFKKDSAHRDEVLSRMPAWMDEVTWCAIWRAVKAETADRNPSLRVGSEEFLKAAGERFTEVIAKTQVYDSVLARSANMRSKGGLMKMMTAFMAEPTTTINMFGRGIKMMLDPKTRKKGARYCSAVVAAAIYNSALVSIIYAMRDDDEDETYLEKYVSSFASETVDSMNPFSYLPFYRDIMSILQGWDVARSDMTLFTRVKDALLALESAYEDGGAAEQADAWVNFAATLTDFFGLPFRNIFRDVKAGFNFAAVLKEDFTGRGTTFGAFSDQVQEGLRQLAPLSDLYWDKDTKSDKLYSAIMNGDKAYYERMADNYDSDSALQSAIRKGLRENDERIGQAAKAYLAGDMEEYSFLIEQIGGEGKFDESTVRAAVSAEINGEREDARGDDAPDTDDLTAAYESGDNARAEEIMEELVSAKIEECLLKAQAEAYEKGDSFDEDDAREEAEAKARTSVRSTVTRYWKPLYVAAYQSGDVDECERIEDILTDSGLYGNAKNLRKTLKSWRSDG